MTTLNIFECIKQAENEIDESLCCLMRVFFDECQDDIVMREYSCEEMFSDIIDEQNPYAIKTATDLYTTIQYNKGLRDAYKSILEYRAMDTNNKLINAIDKYPETTDIDRKE